MLRRWLGSKRPRWAEGLSESDYQAFRTSVDAMLRDRGHAPNWDEWEAGVTVALDERFISRIALERIAGVYRAAPDEDRLSILEGFLANIGSTPPNADAVSWDAARDRLLAKVYPVDAFAGELSEDVHSRPVAEDLVAILQLEQDNGFRSLARAVTDPWGISDEEMWTKARDNIHDRVPLTDESREVEPGVTVRVLHGPHRLVVSHLLELDRHLKTSAPNGVLVGLPHENLLQFHEFADASAEGALGYILYGTAEMFAGSPGTALSPHTYWWRQGSMTSLTVPTDDGQSIRLEPPTEFDQLMRRLIATGAGGS